MHGDDQYLETQVMTAKPHQLHLMVVDGAIRFATLAEEALRDSDFETAHDALNASRGFVAELISGLNPEQAPEMVEQLKALFAFVYRNLATADIDHETALVSDAIRILKMHRETWLELIESLDASQPAAETSPMTGQDPQIRSWAG